MLELTADDLGGSRSRADNEQERVRALDQVLYRLPPLVAASDVIAIQRHIPARRLDCSGEQCDGVLISTAVAHEGVEQRARAAFYFNRCYRHQGLA